MHWLRRLEFKPLESNDTIQMGGPNNNFGAFLLFSFTSKKLLINTKCIENSMLVALRAETTFPCPKYVEHREN